MLIPGATWRFHYLVDLQNPANTGKVLPATFSFVGVQGDDLIVDFSAEGERQTLGLNLFKSQILTLAIAGDSTGTDIIFDPELVHFAYPLSIGKKWNNDLYFTGQVGGQKMEGSMTSIFEVIDQERLTTPAGSFETLVLDNEMVFPALSLRYSIRLWVSQDGLLVKRVTTTNGVTVQDIELAGFDQPLSSLLDEAERELSLLLTKIEGQRSSGDGLALRPVRSLVKAALNALMRTSASSPTHDVRANLEKARQDLLRAILIMDRRSRAGFDLQSLVTGATNIREHIAFIQRSFR
jgi:hypothetical protein